MTICYVFGLTCLLYFASATRDEIGVTREIWLNVNGNSIQNLLADSRFPHRPNFVKFIKDFDIPSDDKKQYTNNAQRIKGYFIAPQNGEYKFYSSCSGSCEIFLGLNGMEGENNRIISQTQPTKHNEFERYPEQVSHTIALEQGKKYYIEAISKENDVSNDDDNLSVGVELPDGKKMFPISEELLRRSKTTTTGVSGQKSSVIVPKPMSSSNKRYSKNGGNRAVYVSGVHRTLSQAKKTKNNSDPPVVDLEGKKYNDKDAIEPGINIFSEENDDQKNFVDNSDAVASGEHDGGMKEGDENIEFSFDDKPSSEISKASDNDKNSRIIEAHFGNENKSLANALKEHVKMSKLKVIMPGGNQLKLAGSDGSRNTNNANVILPSKTGNSDKVSSTSTSDANDAVTIDVKDKSISKNLTDTVTKNIQSVDFTAKKTKTARIVGKIIRLVGHNRPTRNQTKTTGKTRSFDEGGGFGGFDGGPGVMGGFGAGGDIPHGDTMSLGHGTFEGGHDGGGVGLPLGVHGTMPIDSHGAMPEGHGHLMPLHNTGAVAMVPALLHHDRPEYDHETGDYHGGGTHVEPLVPVQNGGQIIEGPHEGHVGMGHGGGMEHAMGMMHPHGAIDMDHGVGHHIPEIHGEMHHDDYHHHIEPVPIMPAAPVAPAKPAHHKPDIIKVEFVPEEATVEATNKSQISQPSSRKAGTVRVQFIPGDLRETATASGVTRHSSATVENRESSVTISENREPSSKGNSEETMTVSTNKGQEKTTLNNIKISITGEKEKPSSSGAVGAVSFDTNKDEKSTKVKSKNGYEVNPKLPAQGGVSRDSSSESVEAASSSVGVGGGGGGGGPMASFSGGDDIVERVDPPLTTLGQQYVNSLQADQKAAVAQQKINNGNDDRVYFGSQNTGPDPNPTHDAPSDPSVQSEPGYHGPNINPVANHLMEAMNQKAVTPEEALQMMNDFVSGNQDMSKAARNMEGMLGQVAANKEHVAESRSEDPTPARGEFPDSSSVQSQPDETQPHFIDDPNQLNPNFNSGYSDPTFQKETPHEQSFQGNSPMNSGLFNEHNEHSTPAFDYQPSQRDQQQEQPSMEHMGISNSETLTKINQVSPDGPPPPVHIYDSEKGSNPTHDPPQQNLVMEPVKSDYDGFANPSFHKSIPQLPLSGSLNSIIDKIDPHENHQTNEEGSFFSAPNDNTIAQPSESTITNSMPTSQVMPETQEMPHINTGPQPFAVHQPSNTEIAGTINQQNVFNNDVASVPPSEEAPNTESFNNDQAEVDMPHGHLAPAFPVGETSMGYTDDSANFARKFQMPQRNQGTKHGAPLLRKTKLKEEVGNRKHQVIADLYADAIFPEDFSDIESLKGSLQGKTLTNFDKETSVEHHIAGTKKSLGKVHPEIKASFPLEGSIVEGAALRSKVPKSPRLTEGKHHIHLRKSHQKKPGKSLKPKTKSIHKKIPKVYRYKGKERKGKRSRQSLSRKRRGLTSNEAYAVPRKNSRYFHHIGRLASKNIKSNIHAVNTGLHRVRPNLPSLKTIRTNYARENNTLESEEVSNSMYPQKTDWADIHPVTGSAITDMHLVTGGQVSDADVPKDYGHALQTDSSNTKGDQRKITHIENSQIIEHPSSYDTPEYHPKSVKTDQAKLRQLVTELKDVLHKLHESNPTVKQQLLTDGSSVNLGSYVNDATPDMAQYEAVSKGDILSAFANVGKPQPIRSVDIESYTQDVWEPGLKGLGDSLYGPGIQFKRDKLPDVKRKLKH